MVTTTNKYIRLG